MRGETADIEAKCDALEAVLKEGFAPTAHSMKLLVPASDYHAVSLAGSEQGYAGSEQ